MGDVYEARDEELSIPVAIKMLRLAAGERPEALRRLKREVLLARAVADPHVCRVFDLGRHVDAAGPVWFLSMEFLPGETLAERLRKRRRLDSAAAWPIAEQMIAGLAAAHRAGVVHRDFKSANVMLVQDSEGERAIVTDFGVARGRGGSTEAEPEKPRPVRASSQATSSGGLVGTPAYMAPEQVRGEEAGPAADIYALGVVLFEMVTGRWPYEGRSGLEIALRRLSEPAPSPRLHVPELDPA
jgi:serine/threonine protein kinase